MKSEAMLRKKERLLESKKRLICRGALKVLKKKKFHAASMREIAEAVGMSLGNIYYYFEKKDDILVFIYKELSKHIWRRIRAIRKEYDHPIDQLSRVIRALFDLACREKDEVLVILTETKSLDRDHLHELLQHEAEIVDAIAEIIKRGVSRGFFKCAEPHLMADIIAYNIWIIPLRGWNILQRNSEKDVREQIVCCVLGKLEVSTKSDGKDGAGFQGLGGHSTRIKKGRGAKDDSDSTRPIKKKQGNVSGQGRPGRPGKR